MLFKQNKFKESGEAPEIEKAKGKSVRKFDAGEGKIP